MKLRLKLILAFLLLSVVPMSVVIGYSYFSSQRVFRRAVEAEARALAEEMGRRMEAVREGVNREVVRLSRLPFRSMMGKQTPDLDLHKDPVLAEMMRRMGEEGSMVESLEFEPRPPGPPPSSVPAEASLAPPARNPYPVLPKLPRIIIHLSRLLGTDRAVESIVEAAGGALPRMGSQPGESGMPPLPPPPGRMPGDGRTDLQKSADAEASARFAVEMLKKRAETVHRAMESWGQLTDAEKTALEEKRRRMKMMLGREFGSEVRREGEVIGTMKAQVSPEKVLKQVLSWNRRQQDEIPFAVDAEGKIHTANPSDLKLLETLPLKDPSAIESNAAGKNPELSNWIVVSRKDPESGMSFGIARPIRQTLEEIRRTAVRNFSYGMGIIGLAVLGILPLSGRLTRNLTLLTRSAEELAKGNLDVTVPVGSGDELGQLARTFNRMAQELKQNQKKLVAQERLSKELEMCRRIQEELLPRSPLSFGIGEVKGVSIPARELGGDFFNYFTLPTGELAVLVGDVSGKGVPAALLMANLQATLRARLPLGTGLAELADQLDREIADSTPPELFLTLFMAVLDRPGQVLRYVNAGHNTQYALRGNGVLQQMESTGRPLGLLPGGGYSERQLDLSDGDSLFLYTDGLVESENVAGEEFGSKPLEKILIEGCSSGLDNLMATVEAAIREHCGEAEAHDDATMVVLRVGLPQFAKYEARAAS